MEKTDVHISRWLMPLAWLYGAGVWLRNRAFDWGWFRSEAFDVPVVCVGNLAVGGTGKTPHIEYLVRLLQRRGFEVATLSRGYRRKTRGYLLADGASDARQIGDEPCQMKRKFPKLRVAVDEDRRHGIGQLLKLDHPPVDAVLLDDAYQHRYVRAGLNLLLTDCHRLFCDDALLPAGRLREPASGKMRAQVVVVTKCPPDLSREEADAIGLRLKLDASQQLYFSTLRYGTLTPLFPETQALTSDRPADIADFDHILLVTGIAVPAPLVAEIARSKRPTARLEVLSFADHHDFDAADVARIARCFSQLGPGRRAMITTEKDGVRLTGLTALDPSLKTAAYVLPVEIAILFDRQQQFEQNIIDYVSKYPRNRRLHP